MVLSPNIFKFQIVTGSPFTFGSHLSHPGAAVTTQAIGWFTSVIFNCLWPILFKTGNSVRHANSIF